MFLSILLQVATEASNSYFGLAAIGASISALAAGIGIGRIGGEAMQAIARQPEAANDIRSNMILAAALVEGAAMFGIVVGLLAMVL